MTFFGRNQADPKSTMGKKDILHIVLFTLILCGIIFFLNYRKTKLLEDSNNTAFAIVKDKSSGYLSNNLIYIEYKKDGKIFESEGIQMDSCFNKLRIGDTVLIKYSLKDPKVVAIVDCDK
ncbi:hypothetical protein H9Y05_14340 [Crocinitomicaceae bacterium CZZ-1]|uniref:DUF3592 domain-containing protein n=1 Tax=Taishania pollutisoli TaxID=2766479 RepID=A0A8J6PAW7_9FLAO|nr:hypothetical protein [Taishania pollutisoli]MBC9813651.1 hypothetical protein [Taishania pollutisoli]